MNAPPRTGRPRRSPFASPPGWALAWLFAASGCGADAPSPPPADASTDLPADLGRDAADDDVPSDDVPSDDAGPADAAPPVWRRCHRAFLCADVSVPYDWTRPGGARATVGVLRIPARRPDDRLGVLMMNFGGPGAPTIEQVAATYPRVFNTPHDGEIADRFDLVAVDWRGLGRGAPSLACGATRTHDPPVDLDRDVESDAAWASLAAEAMRAQRSCAAVVAPEFLARVSSDDAARDMDHVRALLGEASVSYVGYSYGTRLGASYLALFPTRVRAFVLDSPIGPDLDLRASVRDTGASIDAAIGRFTAWCAGSAACAFRGDGRTADAVRQRFDALVAAMDRAPFAVGKRRVTGFAAVNALVLSSYTPSSTWPALGAALAGARDGDASGLARIGDSGWLDDAFTSGYFAIFALDTPVARDETLDGFRAFLRAELSPHARRALADMAGFVGWPARRPAPAASLHGLSAPPALIVGSRGDIATPYPWATALRDAFANGSHLVTYEGAGHATSTLVPCVGQLVADFLFDPTAPPARSACPAVDP